MDPQNLMDYDYRGQAHSSQPQHRSKAVNAWIKEKNAKEDIFPYPKDSNYPSMKVYMKGILRHSLITSVPQIAVTKNWIKKIIKIFVFILCLIGFIYQTQNFLAIYLSYPTVSNVIISNPVSIIQPAITVCNLNPFRRSASCINKFYECNYTDEKELCQKHPIYCPMGKKPFTGIPTRRRTNESFPKAAKEFWKLVFKLAHNDSMINHCRKTNGKNRTSCKMRYLRVPIGGPKSPNSCYTIESLWKKPEAELPWYKSFGYELLLETQPEEYLNDRNAPSTQIAIHDPRRLVNPFSEGLRFMGGTMYEIRVHMTEKKLLPAPYDTNCTDYLKLWRENNGTGPMNDLECIEYCKLNSLLKEGKCIDRSVAYPHMEQLCNTPEVSVTSEINENCMKSCGSPCYDYSYDVKFDDVDLYDWADCQDNEWCSLARIYLKINFKSLRLTTIQYRPKFESVELFSFIGGYMGMWLGLSLVAIFDFLETLFYIVYFPIGRWRRTRRRKLRRSFKHDEAGDSRSHVF